MEIFPERWHWEKPPTWKRLAWWAHVAVFVAAIAALVYYVVSPLVGPSIIDIEQGAQPQSTGAPAARRPPPLPYWVRVLQAMGPVVAPIITYGLYRWLPEPDSD